jgi:hypothetical protein
MDSWIWDQVSLEFSNINVKGTVESEGGGQRGDNLSDESVQVGVGWSLNVQVSSADVINGLVIEHNSDISVLKKRVGGEDGVIWLNNSGGNLWGWVDGESELGFLSIIDGKSLEEEGSESRSSSTTNRVEDEESLKSGTLVSQFSDSVEAEIDDFFTNGVVTSGEVVSGIFFSGDELFWVEKLSVGSSSDFINNGWFQIEHNGSWDVFTGTGFREKGVESIISSSDGFVRWHLTVWLDSVFKTE